MRGTACDTRCRIGLGARRIVRVIWRRSPYPKVWVVRLRVGSCLIISISDLFHRAKLIALPVRVSEVCFCIIQLIHYRPEIITELSRAIRLVATLEVCQEPRDDSVCCAEKDGCCTSSPVIESTKHRKGRRNEDLSEKK